MHLTLTLLELECLKQKEPKGDELYFIIADESGAEPEVRRLPKTEECWVMEDGDRKAFAIKLIDQDFGASAKVVIHLLESDAGNLANLPLLGGMLKSITDAIENNQYGEIKVFIRESKLSVEPGADTATVDHNVSDERIFHFRGADVRYRGVVSFSYS